MPDQFLATIAIHHTSYRIAINDRPGTIGIMRINERDSIWRGFKQCSKQEFALLLRPLRPLALGDVAASTHQPDDFSLAIAQRYLGRQYTDQIALRIKPKFFTIDNCYPGF
jgi:hypothetical protein